MRSHAKKLYTNKKHTKKPKVKAKNILKKNRRKNKTKKTSVGGEEGREAGYDQVISGKKTTGQKKKKDGDDTFWLGYCFFVVFE